MSVETKVTEALHRYTLWMHGSRTDATEAELDAYEALEPFNSKARFPMMLLKLKGYGNAVAVDLEAWACMRDVFPESADDVFDGEAATATRDDDGSVRLDDGGDRVSNMVNSGFYDDTDTALPIVIVRFRR